MKREELQVLFYIETRTECINSQGEFDIDYVKWLENKVIADLEIKEPLSNQEDKWVSVEEKLPKDGQIVIIFWIYENKKRITSGSYNYYGKYWQHGAATQMKVTHWQPLPSPPKQ